MAQYFEIHPDNPQKRLIAQSVEIIRRGGVVVFPTDSSYALACHLGDKRALDRIRQIRRIDDKHNFTLLCRDLTEIANFSKVDNEAYRLIKSLTPGPFTFVLKATREVPRRLQHPKRKTVGIRVPDHQVAQLILEELGEPLFSTTLILPGQSMAMTEAYEIVDELGHTVDLVIDAGSVPYQPTTIIAWDTGLPEIVRQGKGEADFLEY